MKLLKILILLIFVLGNSNIHAQYETKPYSVSNEVAEYIESSMNTKYDGTFSISIYFIMDSLINRVPYNYLDEKFEDPFGTLKGVSIFSCQKLTESRDSSIVGIYKNGQILWDSGPIIFGNILSNLAFCKDINKDSVVDIGLISEFADFSESYNPNNITDYLWILSWNGNMGIFINDFDINTRKSKLVPGPFNLFDKNGDGIYEISTMYFYDEDYIYSPLENPPPNYPYVTYGWNGSKYGLWPDVYQLKKGDFYPATWIEPTIKCKVIRENSLLKFQYSVTNGINSLQKIDYICIANIPTQNVDESSEYHNGILSSSGLIPNSWAFSPTLGSYSSLINPGQTKSDYWFLASGLPMITYAYLQGLVDIELTREITVESQIDEIYNNSVKRKTVGLKSIPALLDTIGFLDTIKTYIDSSYLLGWIKDGLTYSKYNTYLANAKTQLQQNNINAARATLQTVLQQVDIDSTDNLTSEAYALIKYNTEYLLKKIPEQPNNPNLVVNLKNSLSNQLPASNVQYYEGSWKDAVNNGDGTFTVITTKPKVSIRIYYEYASLQADNVTAQNNTYTFQTVNAAVQLKNSLGNLMPAPMGDQGTVQYYAGAWRSFGTTSNGVAYKELLPINYSFRMTYEYGSIDKQQNLSTDPTVVFQTVNAAVQLKNSLGNLIDQGTVQYYAGAWRSFGTTSNGVAYKELLPINYSFRMTYEYVSKDKQQNLSTNPVVDFSTVLCSVKVSKSSNNQPINNSAVKYYAGAWRNLGTTNVDGITTKELLPANISFRASYGNVSADKQQDISVNNLVEILLNVP